MKTVWITALTKDKDRVGMAATTLKRYGMQSQGHFWLDEPDKATARVVLDAMLAAKADAWIVLADATSLAGHGVRYGLSLLAASLAAERGAAMPTVCLWPAGTPEDVMSTAHLPALLHTAAGFIENGPTWAVKLVAALAKPAAPQRPASLGDYRLTLWGDENIGQWLEIGPTSKPLAGFAFGMPSAATADGEAAPAIVFQAVGPRGGLPQKTVLEYAQQGFKMQIGDREYTSWAVRNTITPDQSYFVRITGCPESLVCMPYPDADDVEATVIPMR
jgi:hypothetical protein